MELELLQSVELNKNRTGLRFPWLASSCGTRPARPTQKNRLLFQKEDFRQTHTHRRQNLRLRNGRHFSQRNQTRHKRRRHPRRQIHSTRTTRQVRVYKVDLLYDYFLIV